MFLASGGMNEFLASGEMSEGFQLSGSESSFRGRRAEGCVEPAAGQKQDRERSTGPGAGVGLQPSHGWAMWEE